VRTLSDAELHALLLEDPERGWRAFVDQYTPALVALIERAGVRDRDAVSEVYVRVCERLAAQGCRRLRRFDPGRGSYAAWLTVLVRRTVVDWLRARAGRRRLFGAVRRLEPFDQRVFELFHWERRRVSEIVVELAGAHAPPPVDTARVLDALARIDGALSERHRSELVSQRARAGDGRETLEDAERLPDAAADPERAALVGELDARFAAALAALPSEDAAILRLTYVQGWPRATVRRALRLAELPASRIQGILERLRAELARRRLGPAEAAVGGLRFLEEDGG
jgi:DNA-directed RNA polymerase specialized sigma24 family protein